MENESSYFLVIPWPVLANLELPANAKLLYGRISGLTREHGYCYASNKALGLLGDQEWLPEKTVERLLKDLETQGYIMRQAARGKDGKGSERRIYLTLSATYGQPPLNIEGPTPQYWGDPPLKNEDHNNKYNNIKENKKKEKPDKAKAPPLTDDELKARIYDWISANLSNAPREAKNAVYNALLNFYSPRDKNPSRYPAAVSTALNRLLRFSGGDPGAMVGILEEAVQKKWQGIYPGDGRSVVIPTAQPDTMGWLGGDS